MSEKVDDLADLELLASDDGDSDSGRSVSLGSRSSGEGSGDEDDDDEGEVTSEHYAALRSTVVDIVTALGGLEDVARPDGTIDSVYAIGDDCLRCLRDLRSLLQHDQEDAARTVPRIFGEVNVVQRGLLPLLLKTADMGERGSKIALACTDILTTLTWPIDAAAERQAIAQRDGDIASLDSLSHMQSLLVSYKLAVLRAKSEETKGTQRSVLSAVMLHILLPSLSKPRHTRTERDTGTISMCLHLFRNLVAIKDPLATSLSSHEQVTLSNLQNDLISEMQKAHVLDTLLMLASNAGTRDYEPWNVVAAEFILHIFVAAHPTHLLSPPTRSANETTATANADGASSSRNNLRSLLSSEAEERRAKMLSAGASRHSRYTTTISFRSADGELRTASTQAALKKDNEKLNQHWRQKTQRNVHRKKKMEEVGATRRPGPWSSATKAILSDWAQQFLRLGFENLIRSLVKDVRSESAKVGDIALTRIRIMQMSTFFLRYFLLLRQGQEAAGSATAEWPFDLIGYWLEPWALKMAWMRAANAREDRAWLEFVAAVKLWTTLLRTVEAMSRSQEQRDMDIADGIMAVHFYDELALDSAKAVTKTYTAQSFRCLETIVEFSYVMPRLLEKYSKDKDNLFVKAKKQMRTQTKEGGVDAEEEQQTLRRSVEDQIKERKFEFEKFQAHISSHNLTEACLLFLQRWRNVQDDVGEHISAAVHVLHRLVVKAGSLRLLFPHRHRVTLKSLEDETAMWQLLRQSAPQAASDANKLIKYVFLKFDRLDDSEKAMWAEGLKAPKPVKIFKMPAEIAIVPSRGREEDVRIAVGLLVEKDLLRVISWVKSGLEEAQRVKAGIVLEEKTNAGPDADESDWVSDVPPAAIERFEDLQLPYNGNDTLREDASVKPEVKLLCRLLGLESNEDDDHHWLWTIVAQATPEMLEQDADLLDNAIRFPVDMFGEKFEGLVTRVRKAPTRRCVTVDADGDDEEVYLPRGRGSRKDQRKNTFLDDDFIEDSDEELEAVARLMQQQGGGNESDEASSHGGDTEVDDINVRNRSSPRRDRESSATGSSVHRSPSEVPDKSRKRKRFMRAVAPARNTDALFLGAESDDDDANDATSARDVSVSADKHEESRTAAPLRAARAFVDESDDDESDAEAEAQQQGRIDGLSHVDKYNTTLRAPLIVTADNAMDDTTDTTAPTARKRRALLIEDEDDE